MGRKLGQVFLSNYSIVDKIIEELNIQTDELIIEIGPGRGVLTDPLSRSGAKIIAIEVDEVLHRKLVKEYQGNSNVSIISADVLNVSLKDIAGNYPPEKVKVVGNIPYYITSPIIEHLINFKQCFRHAVIMMQYEVGERILASNNSRIYGSLTLFVQYNMVVEKVIEVSKEDFTPPPKVNSIILGFFPRSEPKVNVKNEALLFKIIRLAFQKRRKMLRNSLSDLQLLAGDIELTEIFKQAGIIETARAENLTLEDYARLAEVLDNGENE